MRCRVCSGMARADGASFSTAETVPGARATRAATSRRVTRPGWLRLEFFFFRFSFAAFIAHSPHQGSSMVASDNRFLTEFGRGVANDFDRGNNLPQIVVAKRQVRMLQLCLQ